MSSLSTTKAIEAFERSLPEYQARVEKALDFYLPALITHPTRLHHAMRYAMLGGGKRLRPVLVYGAGSALGVVMDWLDAPACAVELIHGYSLVHDDLPAMDDDNFRRGKPTCHRAYDEATAILVGDALQALAFQCLAQGTTVERPAARLQMIHTLSQASGSRGMVGGQAIDLASTGKMLDIAQLEDMHIHKTGALIRASVTLGALSHPDPDERLVDRLDHYGKCIGLAFQIQDDVLDVEGTDESLGKRSGADARLNKPTYPALLGMDEAKRRARELVDDALQTLSPFDQRADVLRGLAAYVISRNH